MRLPVSPPGHISFAPSLVSLRHLRNQVARSIEILTYKVPKTKSLPSSDGRLALLMNSSERVDEVHKENVFSERDKPHGERTFFQTNVNNRKVLAYPMWFSRFDEILRHTVPGLHGAKSTGQVHVLAADQFPVICCKDPVRRTSVAVLENVPIADERAPAKEFVVEPDVEFDCGVRFRIGDALSFSAFPFFLVIAPPTEADGIVIPFFFLGLRFRITLTRIVLRNLSGIPHCPHLQIQRFFLCEGAEGE